MLLIILLIFSLFFFFFFADFSITPITISTLIFHWFSLPFLLRRRLSSFDIASFISPLSDDFFAFFRHMPFTDCYLRCRFSFVFALRHAMPCRLLRWLLPFYVFIVISLLCCRCRFCHYDFRRRFSPLFLSLSFRLIIFHTPFLLFAFADYFACCHAISLARCWFSLAYFAIAFSLSYLLRHYFLRYFFFIDDYYHYADAAACWYFCRHYAFDIFRSFSPLIFFLFSLTPPLIRDAAFFHYFALLLFRHFAAISLIIFRHVAALLTWCLCLPLLRHAMMLSRCLYAMFFFCHAWFRWCCLFAAVAIITLPFSRWYAIDFHYFFDAIAIDFLHFLLRWLLSLISFAAYFLRYFLRILRFRRYCLPLLIFRCYAFTIILHAFIFFAIVVDGYYNWCHAMPRLRFAMLPPPMLDAIYALFSPWYFTLPFYATDIAADYFDAAYFFACCAFATPPCRAFSR